ncbi:tyrosine-type recombinase/integrase [Streptosporangium sp. G12]
MTILVGEIVDSALAIPAPEPDLLSRMTAGWLWSFTSRNTRKAYSRHLRQWLAFCEKRGQDPLTVTRAHGDLYARWLECQDPPPAAKTVSLKLAAVSSWYAYLVAEDVISANKFGGATRPRIDRSHSETVGLEQMEARAMVAAADAGSGRERLRTAALIRVMLSLGPRAAEVCSLTVGSLGFERGFRTVRIVGKGKKVRTRTVPPSTAEAIDRYLEERAAGGVLDPEAPLFATESGRSLSPRYLFGLVRRVAKEAGLECPGRVTPHALRHTFATLGDEAGASLSELQDALGHASPETTKIYIHAKNRLERDPSQRVAMIL